jgi:hypothetical protein
MGGGGEGNFTASQLLLFNLFSASQLLVHTSVTDPQPLHSFFTILLLLYLVTAS